MGPSHSLFPTLLLPDSAMSSIQPLPYNPKSVIPNTSQGELIVPLSNGGPRLNVMTEEGADRFFAAFPPGQALSVQMAYISSLRDSMSSRTVSAKKRKKIGAEMTMCYSVLGYSAVFGRDEIFSHLDSETQFKPIVQHAQQCLKNAASDSGSAWIRKGELEVRQRTFLNCL